MLCAVLGNVCHVTSEPVFRFVHSDNWSRARVESLAAPGSDDVNVYFVDYGNRCAVPLSNTRPCPAATQHYPPLAVKCRLDQLQVRDVTRELHSAFVDRALNSTCRVVATATAPDGVSLVRLLVPPAGDASAGVEAFEDMASILQQIGESTTLIAVLPYSAIVGSSRQKFLE